MKRYIVLWNENDQQKILSWWNSLQSREKGRGPSRTGWRAELRRAERPEDILLTRGFRALYYDLTGTKWIKEENLLGLATAAGILAHIDINEILSFAVSCAKPGEGKEKPALSELRFSQLQKSHTLDELFIRMRRAILILGRKANVISVADSILHWYTEMINSKVEYETRNRILVRWGLDYFQNLPRTEAK